MIIKFATSKKDFIYKRVQKLVCIGNETTIGYLDDKNEYREESGPTPLEIAIINLGDNDVLTLASKEEELTLEKEETK